MRVLALVYTLAAFVARLHAAPSATDLAVWPDRGPYRTVGQPGLVVLKMPAQVVEAIQQVIPEDPSQWEIVENTNLSGHGKRVLLIETQFREMNFLVDRGLWIDPQKPGAVLFLNDVLVPLQPADLQNEKTLTRYSMPSYPYTPATPSSCRTACGAIVSPKARSVAGSSRKKRNPRFSPCVTIRL